MTLKAADQTACAQVSRTWNYSCRNIRYLLWSLSRKFFGSGSNNQIPIGDEFSARQETADREVLSDGIAGGILENWLLKACEKITG
ncbi:MAG: hypothetical protein ACLUGJ_01275 [Blautia wexlerae]